MDFLLEGFLKMINRNYKARDDRDDYKARDDYRNEKMPAFQLHKFQSEFNFN